VDADLRDLLAAFLAHRVRFLVVGAHALAVHGVPRATGDLDVWVEPTAANAQCIWQALAAFGAPLDALRIGPDDFTRPDVVVQLGLPPRRVDVLTSASGLTFAAAWEDRVEATIDDLVVPFLGRASLIRNKRASGRPKDLRDLDALGEV
jgi:hypothetical protein